jgi:hypothetical protein
VAVPRRSIQLAGIDPSKENLIKKYFARDFNAKPHSNAQKSVKGRTSIIKQSGSFLFAKQI